MDLMGGAKLNQTMCFMACFVLYSVVWIRSHGYMPSVWIRSSFTQCNEDYINGSEEVRDSVSDC